MNVVFLDMQSEMALLSFEGKVHHISFANIDKLYTIIRGETILYVTNAINANADQITGLVKQVYKGPVNTISKPDLNEPLYVRYTGNGSLIIDDFGQKNGDGEFEPFRFMNNLSFYRLDQLNTLGFDKSAKVKALLEHGKLKIAYHAELMEDSKDARAKKAKLEKMKDDAINSMIRDRGPDDDNDMDMDLTSEVNSGVRKIGGDGGYGNEGHLITDAEMID